MDKQEANAKVAELLQQVYNLLAEAEAVADKAGIYFHFDNGVYGMGGGYDGDSGEWNASSQSC